MKRRDNLKKSNIPPSISARSNTKAKSSLSKQAFGEKSSRKSGLTLKRNAKSESNDTLVGNNSASIPSREFLNSLNRSASKIQIWFRTIKQKQLRDSISTLDIKDIDIEQDALKRRKMIEVVAKQQALKELKESPRNTEITQEFCSMANDTVSGDIALVEQFYADETSNGNDKKSFHQPKEIISNTYSPSPGAFEPQSDENDSTTVVTGGLKSKTGVEIELSTTKEIEKSASNAGVYTTVLDSNEIIPSSPIDLISGSLAPTLRTKIVESDETEQSVTRILSFLKSVEADQRPTTPNLSTCNNHSPEIFDNVKQKIISFQLEISQKAKTITALQQELERLRQSTATELDQSHKSHKSQLTLQRKEYEGIIKRHLGFIDNVLGEKEALTQKTMELSEKVLQMERQFKQKTIELEESHQRNLVKQKEIWAVGEKTRRDKWIQEKSKAIKEQTIQALEPEIQKLLANHKSALMLAEENYKNMLAKEKNALTESHQIVLDQNREKYILDRQKACEEEREFARQRYLKQLEREEMEFQQQKRKIQSEFEQERFRQQESTRETIQSLETSNRRQLDQLRSQLERQGEEYQSKIDQLQRNHCLEIEKLKEEFVIEKQEWQQNYMTKVESQQRQRDKLFKEQLIKQRDEEIEAVIERLESETGSNNSDAMRRYRMDVERIKAETADEIKQYQLRDQHSMALDKLLIAQKSVSDLEAQVRELQKSKLQQEHQILSKDSILNRQKIELSRLTADESVLIKDIRQEYEKELKLKNEEINNLRVSIETEKKTSQEALKELGDKISRIELEKVKTLNQVEAQVRATLATKDQKLEQLQALLQQEQLKSTQLEKLMDQQRNELLGL